ncbi:intermembrane phospholipid transport protein YdbH family protein [Glacieibacterium sp.]|uniref:intermembrane phospholipid transport protein YdbH family protein n=1 Tax=Glacieibacterium sp. TaxID=2860237 RepID=UPI003B00E298
MSRLIRLLLIILLLLALLVTVAWLSRAPLSEAVVARWFAAQGVAARYRITAISPSAVTLADVSLGPQTLPDFTAERIDAQLGWSLLSPGLKAVTLIRPVLRATLSDKGFSLGSLDRLLPKNATPQPLPDIDLRVVGARVSVATPFGMLAGTAQGNGRLRGGFTGAARLDPATLAGAGCTTAVPGMDITVAMARRETRLAANGLMPRLACAAGIANTLRWQLAATLPPTLDSYRATVTASTAGVEGGGYRSGAAKLTADASAATLSGPLAGKFTLAATSLRGAAGTAKQVAANGNYRFDSARREAGGDALVKLDGAATVVPATWLRAPARRAAGTLGQPLLDGLSARIEAAARSFDGTAQISASNREGRLHAAVTGLALAANNGARLTQTGSVTYDDGAVSISGGASIASGGLPVTRLTADGRWQRGAFDGRATLAAARWMVPGATLDALSLTARSDGGGAILDGGVRVSGKLGGGIVADRLGIPLALRLGPGMALRFDQHCLAVDWQGLSRATLRLAAGRVRLCPSATAPPFVGQGRIGGALASDPVRLAGHYDGTPLALSTAPLRVVLSGSPTAPRVALAPAAITASYGARRLRATIGGTVGANSGNGRIDAAALDDTGLPVAIDDAGGDWRLDHGRVSLSKASARVTDRTAPARFQPLRLIDLGATLSGDTIEAKGSARLDAAPARLFTFAATHALASGTGYATLDTGRLTFGPDLQPYQITENLRGIIDNVVGPIVGTGRFDWTPDTLTSHGSVRIDKLNLATAALGPVDGIDGTVEFDDLLALTTPPGQTLRIARINPGIAVDDGVAVFQMLGPDAAAIDSIRWPYAGGTLTLAPVTIRAGDLRREFKLNVDGLDAQLFLQRFEIKNLNVTGTFDGVLPLVFADEKGRIVTGRMVARQGGGLVQYVGAVGSEEMGAGAKLAFDALRRLRYNELALDLDGDLDGELVTQVRFSGTNETTATIGGGPVPIKATGLPFKFGITVRAPFRALLGTAASLSDVRPLLHAAPAAPVQPR